MPDTLLTAAEQAVALAKKAGVNEVFATATRSRDVSYTVRDGLLEEVKDATSSGLSLRLWVDGRYSSHRTNDLRPDQLVRFIDEAVALTRALAPDPHRSITDARLYEGRAALDLQLVDRTVHALTREDRLAYCTSQNAVITGQPSVISAESGMSDNHTRLAAVASNGFQGTHEDTSVWFGSTVTMADPSGAKPAGSMWAGAMHRADLPEPTEIATQALARGQARLGTAKGPTQRATMVVDPSAAPSLIARLLRPANAGALQQGRSFFKPSDARVVSPLLTITDDPHLPRGFSSRLWDGEGIALRPRQIVERGVLKQLYVDTYYGGKLALTPNGGATNRVLALGDKPLAGLIADIGDGVYVTDWLGGNADATTGDFSFGVQGHLVKGGQIGAPVGEMNITGNLLALFSSLAALGNDPWPYSSIRSPTLVFEGVQFSGV